MENRYMTVNEVSELLRISKSKIYKMTMNSAIPHYKVGSDRLNQFDLISPFSMAA